MAGQTAKSGDMKVSTPTATMGIRGTAVHVEIASDKGTVKFSVMTEPDGHTGRYDVYSNDDPGHVLFTVSDPGVSTTVTPNGQGPLTVVSTAKSATDLAREDSLVKGVFATAASGQQRPIVQPPTEAPVLHPNAPTSSPAGGSSSPPSLIIPDKGFAPSSPAAPDQPANHALADPTTTGSIGRSVAAVATAFVSSAVADAHGVTLATAVATAPPVVVAGVTLEAPAAPAAGALSLPTAVVLGTGAKTSSGSVAAPAGSVATPVGSVAPPHADAATPVPAQTSEIPAATTSVPSVPVPGTPAVEAAVPSPALTVGRALSASAIPGGQPLTVDLLAGVTGGAQGATLSVSDMTYALGQAAAAHALPPGITLAGSSLIFAPSVLASRGAPGATGTITIGFDISDGHGASVHQSLVVTLAPVNTGPTLTLDTPPPVMTEAPGVTAGRGTLAASATFTYTDPDPGQTHRASFDIGNPVWSAGPLLPGFKALLAQAASLTLTNTDPTGTGHVGLVFSAPDKTFDFLAVGETLRFTSTVVVSDAAGATSSQPVTFTINGSNDAPVFDGPAPTTVTVGPAGPGPGRGQTSGSLHFTDADRTDTPTASILKQTVTGHDGPATISRSPPPRPPPWRRPSPSPRTAPIPAPSTGPTPSPTPPSPSCPPARASNSSRRSPSTTSTGADDAGRRHHPDGAARPHRPRPDVRGPAGHRRRGARQGGGCRRRARRAVERHGGRAGSRPERRLRHRASGHSVALPTVPLIGPLPGPLGALLPFGLGTLHADITGTYGTLTLASDGSYSYSADNAPSLGGDDVAQDTFTYTTQDTRGHSATSTLTFTITGRGRPTPTPPDSTTGRTTRSRARTARRCWTGATATTRSPPDMGPPC